MLCVAATQEGGYDALGINWKVANDVAAENGRKMDPEKLRLVGPVHIAETRARSATRTSKFGCANGRTISAASARSPGARAPRRRPVEDLVKSGQIVVGTPDDAIAQIRRLQAKQGEFGVFLQLAHNWANFENTKKSYELWQRHVTPVINGANAKREEAFNWARDNKENFIGAAMSAAMATIVKHNEDEAKKAAKAAE